MTVFIIVIAFIFCLYQLFINTLGGNESNMNLFLIIIVLLIIYSFNKSCTYIEKTFGNRTEINKK